MTLLRHDARSTSVSAECCFVVRVRSAAVRLAFIDDAPRASSSASISLRLDENRSLTSAGTAVTSANPLVTAPHSTPSEFVKPARKYCLVDVAGGLGVAVEDPAVDGSPRPVAAFDGVRDECVGVELRVHVARGPVAKPGNDHSAGLDALHLAVDGPTRDDRPPVEVLECLGDGMVVCVDDMAGGVLVGEPVKHAHRLGCRPRQIPAGRPVRTDSAELALGSGQPTLHQFGERAAVDLAVEAESLGCAADPLAGCFALAGVVVLDPGGDRLDVVVDRPRAWIGASRSSTRRRRHPGTCSCKAVQPRHRDGRRRRTQQPGRGVAAGAKQRLCILCQLKMSVFVPLISVSPDGVASSRWERSAHRVVVVVETCFVRRSRGAPSGLMRTEVVDVDGRVQLVEGLLVDAVEVGDLSMMESPSSRGGGGVMLQWQRRCRRRYHPVVGDAARRGRCDLESFETVQRFHEASGSTEAEGVGEFIEVEGRRDATGESQRHGAPQDP